MNNFGPYIKALREELNESTPRQYSLRKVATDCGIQPSYLSQIENGKMPPPGEETIQKLANILQTDPDVLLAMAGKVSSDLQAIIASRPQLFAKLIRELKNQPDHAILDIVRVVRDGDW